jgi:hypothetical protein
MANTTGQKPKQSSYRCCEIEVKDEDDLAEVIKELRQQFATLHYNDKTLIVELWSGYPIKDN